MTRARLAGTALGLCGLLAMFNPLAFDWNDRDALLGSALILLAALCWAANILYVRAHKWVSTPFQLTFWQTLLASCVLSTLAMLFDGAPEIAWSPALDGAFLYGGVFGTALAYWAMAMVNRSLPAATSSLGILATPVIGVVVSTLALGETIDMSLLVAMAMILSGIAMGTVPLGKRSRSLRSRRARGAEPLRVRNEIGLLRGGHARELGGLPLEQRTVDSVGTRNQRRMGALLDDVAAVEHQDTIEAAHGREPVRDHNRGAPLHQPLHRLLDQRLRFRIEA